MNQIEYIGLHNKLIVIIITINFNNFTPIIDLNHITIEIDLYIIFSYWLSSLITTNTKSYNSLSCEYIPNKSALTQYTLFIVLYMMNNNHFHGNIFFHQWLQNYIKV